MRASKIANHKSSDVALVISSDSGILIELGERPTSDMTPRLLLALTALYAQRPTHTTEEQRQYSELALRLIDKVEAATRAAVAGILQHHPDAPAEVVERLGGERSSRNGDAKVEPHASPGPHCADNEHFKSNQHLAFFAASPAERRRLLSVMARRYGDDPPVAPEDSERGFGSVDVAEFTSEFERLIDIPRSLCERILNDPSGEPMVVAAKATGMPIAVLQRILLLVCAAATHSVGRVYDLTELYHGLDIRAARELLAQWRTQAKSGDPVSEMEADTGDHTPDAPRRKDCAAPQTGEGRVRVSLRSRFSALTERVHSQAVNARYDRGSAARRGLQFR